MLEKQTVEVSYTFNRPLITEWCLLVMIFIHSLLYTRPLMHVCTCTTYWWMYHVLWWCWVSCCQLESPFARNMTSPLKLYCILSVHNSACIYDEVGWQVTDPSDPHISAAVTIRADLAPFYVHHTFTEDYQSSRGGTWSWFSRNVNNNAQQIVHIAVKHIHTH